VPSLTRGSHSYEQVRLAGVRPPCLSMVEVRAERVLDRSGQRDRSTVEVERAVPDVGEAQSLHLAGAESVESAACLPVFRSGTRWSWPRLVSSSTPCLTAACSMSWTTQSTRPSPTACERCSCPTGVTSCSVSATGSPANGPATSDGGRDQVAIPGRLPDRLHRAHQDRSRSDPERRIRLARHAEHILGRRSHGTTQSGTLGQPHKCTRHTGTAGSKTS
jgi:hypothetical protein